MHTAVKIIPNTYRDSVALMQLAARFSAGAGVDQVAIVMATPGNLELLREAGLLQEAVRAQPSDVLIVARAKSPGAAETVLTAAANALDVAPAGAASDGVTAPEAPRSLSAAHRHAPGANLALISVPGEYAAAEARKALALGLHVMLFSDNVSIADEIELKHIAGQRKLLLMGPDCGTAIIDGTPLGFANAVRRGRIGCIAAAGSGLQQVTTLVDRAGEGVSQAIGTGGRDLSDAVGGLTTLAALARLAKDRTTEVIVLIGKPPGEKTALKVLTAAGRVKKPVVVNFIGWAAPARLPANVHIATTLAGAARVAVALAAGKRRAPATIEASPTPPRIKFAARQRYVRGLFSGGTFCYEASLLLGNALGEVCSNASVHPQYQLTDPWHSQGHTLIDLGDDVFTRGRPHPMIDARLRNERLAREADDPTVAVILFDIVLGHGSHSDPAGAIVPAIVAARAKAARAKRPIAFVGFVCGTRADPQDLARQEGQLVDAGVHLAANNAAAAAFAARLVKYLGKR